MLEGLRLNLHAKSSLCGSNDRTLLGISKRALYLWGPIYTSPKHQGVDLVRRKGETITTHPTSIQTASDPPG